jgi:hypothetical protein
MSHFPFGCHVDPPCGPRADTDVVSKCSTPFYKRNTLWVGGEMGAGKTTSSVNSLPSFVGATHGLLYYSCTGDATFEPVELNATAASSSTVPACSIM